MGICVLAVVVVGVMLLWAALTTSAGDTTPVVHKYVEDRFLGLVWRWKYGRDGTIYDLSVFCPACDYQIRPVTHTSWTDPDTTMFECDDCGHKVGPLRGSQYDVESQVERKIQKNLRNQTRPGTEA
jgi:Zn ribbon nucleic-acid-binding protein